MGSRVLLEVTTTTMKFSLTLLVLCGFIAFIGAAPTEAEADANTEEPKEDEEAPEIPEIPNLDDDEEEDPKDEEDTPQDKEDPKNEEDKEVDQENDVEELNEAEGNDLVEDPGKGKKKKLLGRCIGRGFKRRVGCKGKGRKKRCWNCCRKCRHARKCRRVTFFRPACFHYMRLYCKGHRHRVKICHRAKYTCAFYGRCWYRQCIPLLMKKGR